MSKESASGKQQSRAFWRVQDAERLGFLVDGAAYFPAFADLLLAARRQAIILCWDVDSRVRLYRPCDASKAPCRLADVIAEALARNPELEIYLLPWDYAMVYVFEREWQPLFGGNWRSKDRLFVHFDDQHPLGASAHQKMLVVDDYHALVGGFDPSKWRFDDRAHRPDNPQRRDPAGDAYPPFHDVAFYVRGQVGRSLGELARARWAHATGQVLAAPDLEHAEQDFWPQSVAVAVDNVRVGIARTYPEYEAQQAVSEIRQVLLEMIAAARQVIYIENQYFTSHEIGQALAERLQDPDGPEVVLVLPREKDGWLERITMDVLRARLLDTLKQADCYGRLGVFYPQVAGLAPQMVSLHSKLVLVDDLEVNLGSANTSNRSMGFDNELNLSLLGDAPHARNAVAQIRHDLLAEHLGQTPQAIAKAERDSGSTLQTIAEFNRQATQRWLEPLDVALDPELDRQVPDSAIIDPEKARPAAELAQVLIEEKARPSLRRRLLWFAVLLTGLFMGASLLSFTGLGAHVAMYASANTGLHYAAIGAVGVASVLLLIGVPVTVMIILLVLLAGGWAGFGLALSALMLAALGGYTLGLRLTRPQLSALVRHHLDAITARLARPGVLAFVALRLVPLAPFTLVNLAAGANRVGLRDFLLGTFLGVLPAVFAVALFTERLLSALQNPGVMQWLWLAVVTLLLAGGAWLLGLWVRRQERRHE